MKSEYSSNNERLYSFTGALTGVVILTAFVTIPTCFFGYSLIPISEFNNSIIKLISILFLITIMAPIVFTPLFIQLFPYQKIDFSLNAIVKSLGNILFFFCSLPILICFIYFTYISGDLLFKFNSINEGLLFTLFIIDIPLLLWIYVSLHIKELFFGKNSSQTLRYFRQLNRKKSPLKYKKPPFFQANSQKDNILVSKRWLIILSGLIGFPYCAMMLFNQYISIFITSFLILALADLIFILFALWFSKINYNSNNYILRKSNSFSKFIFGTEDISDRSFGYGLLSLFFVWLYIFTYSKGNSLDQNYGYFVLYLISLGIFIITIWNNQIKRFLEKNNSKNIEIHSLKNE